MLTSGAVDLSAHNFDFSTPGLHDCATRRSARKKEIFPGPDRFAPWPNDQECFSLLALSLGASADRPRGGSLLDCGDMSPLFLHGSQGESGSEFKGIRGQTGVKQKRRRAAALQTLSRHLNPVRSVYSHWQPETAKVRANRGDFHR